MNELKQKQLNAQKAIRDSAAIQNETCQHLTFADRRLIKAYLGYIPVKGVRDKSRSKENAPPFVRASLWPTEIQKTEDESPFDLERYVGENENPTTPRIFERETLENTANIFREAAGFDARQQAGVVRSFQVSKIQKKKKKETKLTPINGQKVP